MALGDQPLPGTKGRRLGEIFLPYFVELGGLTPDEAVLEPGCGTGRMAEPLSGYLTTGSYDGFDVVREAIEQCEAKIMQPNFRFRHVDVLNRFYNPEGRIQPDEFQFPYSDESFDFVFLTSVFTHMLPPEVQQYLNEIRRVLRPDGRCLATFFVLNKESLLPHEPQDPLPARRACPSLAASSSLTKAMGIATTLPTRGQKRVSAIGKRMSSNSSSGWASSSRRSATGPGAGVRMQVSSTRTSWW